MEKIKQASNKEIPKREENPFEDEMVSWEWIRSVEGEKGLLRDREVYPRLKNWTTENHPKLLVEIGAGQGICAEKCGLKDGKYIGVEPSEYLVKRAKELYENEKSNFVVGNAYEMPIKNESADAVFSVNVWFHLEDLERASSELARILRLKGKFLIITANPAEDSEKMWESWYYDSTKEGKKISGKVNVPINPLSKNIFYQHTLKEITKALENNGLKIIKSEPFGEVDGVKIFVEIQGKKIGKIIDEK